MEINITEEDIDNGKWANAGCCAIALALNRATNKSVTTFAHICVGHAVVYEWDKELRLPQLLSYAIDFDHYKLKRINRPKPMTFHLSAEVFME